MPYVPLRKAVEFLGLHPNTLRKYADERKIKSVRTPICRLRLFDIGSVGGEAAPSATVCYCRVSSEQQRDDLARQVQFMPERYPEAEIVQDIGARLNFKRKGLRSLLVRIMRGDKLTVVVACRG
jgi:predicted site-specific integrase-resolvase